MRLSLLNSLLCPLSLYLEPSPSLLTVSNPLLFLSPHALNHAFFFCRNCASIGNCHSTHLILCWGTRAVPNVLTAQERRAWKQEHPAPSSQGVTNGGSLQLQMTPSFPLLPFKCRSSPRSPHPAPSLPAPRLLPGGSWWALVGLWDSAGTCADGFWFPRCLLLVPLLIFLMNISNCILMPLRHLAGNSLCAELDTSPPHAVTQRVASPSSQAPAPEPRNLSALHLLS